MARTARVKLSGDGVAHYHVMSRTNDRRFLFDADDVRDMIADSIRRAAEFSGVELEAYTVMSDHFHVVLAVTRNEEPIPEEEIIRRVRVLKGNVAADELARKWSGMYAAGFDMAVVLEANRLRRRMNDVSEFAKTLKEMIDRRYKEHHAYSGSIWSGRFKSTLVEDGEYLSTVKRYVRNNPVRAGMVEIASDYRWSWSKESKNASKQQTFLGTVPKKEGMARVAQIGGGKVFGSETFVRKITFTLGDKFKTKRVSVHAVKVRSAVKADAIEIAGYTTHGWKMNNTKIR